VIHSSFAGSNFFGVDTKWIKKVITCVIIGLGILSIRGINTKYTPHHFMAYIVQDGKQIPIENHVAKLRKAPFTVVVDMPGKKGVFVSVSQKSQTYNLALKNVSVEKLPGFQKSAVYELWKNVNTELLIGGAQPNFWFIDTPAKHRFSSYEKINGRYICEREVDKIYDIYTHNEIPLSSISGKLYFTFIKFEALGSNSRYKELMRHNFKVEWVK